MNDPILFPSSTGLEGDAQVESQTPGVPQINWVALGLIALVFVLVLALANKTNKIPGSIEQHGRTE